MGSPIAARARFLLLVGLPVLTGCALANDNLREVVPARLYRSGQMDVPALARTIERLGVRTVIDLRGGDARQTWWRQEVAVCRSMGVAHHSLRWSYDRLPEPDSLAELVTLLRSSDEPVLVHCKQGVHRAAVASAVFLLLDGRSVCEARRQLGVFFLGARIGDVLRLYEGSRLPFDRWVVEVYPDVHREHEARRS